MLEKFLIEVPQEVADKARIAAEETGRSIESVLSEWMQLINEQQISLNASFPVYTVFGSEAAVPVLRKILRTHSDSADEPA